MESPVPHTLGGGASVPGVLTKSTLGLRPLICNGLCLVVRGSTDHKLDKGLSHAVIPGEAMASPPVAIACSFYLSGLYSQYGVGQGLESLGHQVCAQDGGGSVCPNLGDIVGRFEACDSTTRARAPMESWVPV